MNKMMKPAVVLGLTGALALGSMTASQARVRPLAAAGIGLAAGAVIAGAAANNAYYNGGYHGGYGYAPGYAYAPGYDSYAYSPGYSSPVYAAPSYGYGYDWHRAPEQSRERTLRGHDY